MYPPQQFGIIPPNFFMFHISELDDLFFWFSLHFGQEIGHQGSDDLFFGLHFIALQCGGQKFGQPRGGVKVAKSSPPISKNGKKWSILQNHLPNAPHRFAPLFVTLLSAFIL